jgi:hypothetical protein
MRTNVDLGSEQHIDADDYSGVALNIVNVICSIIEARLRREDSRALCECNEEVAQKISLLKERRDRQRGRKDDIKISGTDVDVDAGMRQYGTFSDPDFWSSDSSSN